MKELCLVHPIRVKSIFQTTFREGPDQSWERLANGDVIVRPQGVQEEYLVPAVNVKYEMRTRTAAAKK